MPPGFQGGSPDRWRPTAHRFRCACSDWQGSRFIWYAASRSRGCATRNSPKRKGKRKSAAGRERCSPSSPCPFAKRTHRKRSEEHTSELQSRLHLVCRLLLEKKKN